MWHSMTIIEYTNPSEFLDILETAFSAPYENELMIGLTSTLISNPAHYKTTPILASIKTQQQKPVVLFLTHPWPIILYAEHTLDSNSIDIIINFLNKKRINVSGINAKSDISPLFSQQWIQNRGCHSKQKMKMTVYTLKKIQKICPCNGKFIKADKTHVSQLNHWAKQFHKEMKLDHESDKYIREHVQYMIESGNAFLWIQDEHPVCMTFRERPHNKGFSIGYVYTPKEERQKGYATSLVHAVCTQSFNESYQYSVLFADKQNPISNHIYKSIGFKEICDYEMDEFRY